MMRRLCVRGDRALLLSDPAGALVRVRCDRDLVSPQENRSIYLKVYNHLQVPVTWHWKDYSGGETVYPVHMQRRMRGHQCKANAAEHWDDEVWHAAGDGFPYKSIGSSQQLVPTQPLGSEEGDTCHYQQTYVEHTWYVRQAGTGAYLGGFYGQSDATVHIHPWTFGDGAATEFGGQEHVPDVDGEKLADHWATGGN